MSLSSWRTFNFFELSPIRDPSSAREGLLYSDPNLTAICRGRGRGDETAFMATSDGTVKEFTVDMQVRTEFTAHEEDEGWTITTLRYLQGTSLLLTLAEKQGIALSLQLWDLDKPNKDGSPHCHSTVSITNGSNTFPLSAFALNSDYSILGFGYADGTVIIARGDIIHDRGSRQRVVYNSSSPITGLEFYEDPADKVVSLFVTSVNQVFTVPTHGRNPGKADNMLEKSNGCAVGCVALDPESKKLVVARDENIVYYSAKMRGESFIFDIPKKSIFPYKQYLVVTTHGSLAASQNALSSLIDSATTRVIIIDTVNKYIAYSGQISNGVRDVFIQWDRINILGADGVLYAVKERDLNRRLDLLKQRHLYDLAIQVATGQGSEREQILQIEKEFGDFLYSEGDLSQAMVHYIEAIDSGQTSQVILKYRESQHISYLTDYLEVLHNKGLATKEHTTLLLNSYAKIKDQEKLAQFIENGASDGKFDFDTAIKICRQSGYYALATYLAKKLGDSDLAVLILLRDLHDYRATLEYIQCLEFNDALNILIQHSRVLLAKHPMETTALLISLFTGKFVPKPLEIQLPKMATSGNENGGQNGIDADNSATDNNGSIAAPVLQSYRAFVNYMSTGLNGFGDHNGNGGQNGSMVPNQHQEPTYQPPKPRLIFSSFIDHPSEFVIFLEACLECYDQFEGDEKSRVDLAGTLFEMYLGLANRAQTAAEKQQWQQKAKDLGLNSKISQTTILLLSHMAGYSDGELLARNRDEGYQIDMFRAAVAVGDVDEAVKILHKHGDEEKELFPLALTFYTSSEDVLAKVGEDEFTFVLNRIKRDKLMAPLEVIQSLTVNSVVTMGHVRQYLLDLINEERQEIDKNQSLVADYRKETKSKRQEIDGQLSDPMVVQYTQCASCRSALDLPAIHFACKHSYHQRCLAHDLENPTCTVCQHDLENIRTVRQAQDELSDRNDLFAASLKESDQKFKVITDFFGRGALSNE